MVLPGAVVRGDVTLGPDSNIWFGVVIRADMAPVRIGARSNVQDNSVLHMDIGNPVLIGDDVTVGHGCILHGCTVGDGALIGMGSTILDGAVIGAGALIGAGSLVTRDTVIAPGAMAFGRPAKQVRFLTAEETKANMDNAVHYVELAKEYV